jgi:hypothetical protein
LRKAQSIELLPSAGKLRGIECLYLEPRESTKVSDLGTILAFISAELQLANLAILASKNSSDIRISCRSHRKVQDAMALQFAEAFGGGGHQQRGVGSASKGGSPPSSRRIACNSNLASLISQRRK